MAPQISALSHADNGKAADWPYDVRPDKSLKMYESVMPAYESFDSVKMA